MSGAISSLVYTFPGQGSFEPKLLRNLYLAQKQIRELFYAVDSASSAILGTPFLPVVLSDNADVTQDASQLGIYLANCATAHLWLARGITPEILVGHSFGDLSALAVSGAYSFEQGARIVCQRVLSLREAAVPGKMAAITAPRADVEAAIQLCAKSSVVAVINHPAQTVVSGPVEELNQLRDHFASRGMSVTVLKSAYAFHSPLLASASRVFEIALRSYHFQPPAHRVFIGTDRQFVSAGTDLARVIAQQLVTPLDFGANLRALFAEGHSRFLECGSGTIVTKVIGALLKGEPQHRAWATFPNPDNITERLDALAGEITGSSPAAKPPAAALTPVPAPDVRIPAIPDSAPFEPVAIVGMGCVLPGGAHNPDLYWRHITTGVNGIVDLTEVDPHAREDFVAGRVSGTTQEIISDKTYTLLNGSILKVDYDRALLGRHMSEGDFSGLTKGQKLAALSMAQLAEHATGKRPALRAQCILGSTADGSAELDEAHFAASMREVLTGVDSDASSKKAFAETLSGALPGWQRDPENLAPHKLYSAVAQSVLGVPADRTYLVDSACSSSLYSLSFGARALRNGEADIVFAGGVFAPGPANNTLFAQFRGLTPTGSRPFDVKADGVVFGDGCGILALKLLSRAIADGDPIRAIIRSDGLSSDGKSPSINVPQSEGQVLAMQAAYTRSGLDPRSIQYVEAHATATPVGDSVELKALRDALPAPQDHPRYLGSVKSLIGHTGWTSGVASVIKICKALEHRRIPRQFNFESPSPTLDLGTSGTAPAIPTEELDWPLNSAGLPRRAGVNGFGFGGTNSHFVIEEYVEPYHRALADQFRDRPRQLPDVVIVAAEGMLPDHDSRFERGDLRMPKKKLVLPDIAEHMDASQYLATMVAEKISAAFPRPSQSRMSVGVVLGIEAKTERGIRANERIFLDRLGRVVRAAGGSQKLLADMRAAVLAKVIPSGPYTLPGLMPNVAASRITHTFNWHGPNLVVDRGTGSFVQALDAGLKLVQEGDCEVVLAGALNAWTGHTSTAREAGMLVALATSETAAKYSLPVIGRIVPARSDAAPVTLDTSDASYRGATGALDALHAIREVSRTSTPVTLTWKGATVVTVAPLVEAAPAPQPRTEESRPAQRGSHAYVQGTPIQNFTHVLVDAPPLASANAARKRSYLFVTDQPEAWRAFEEEGSLQNLTYTVVTPTGVGIRGAHEIDTSTEDTLREGLDGLRHVPFDTIVALKHLSHFRDEDLLLSDFAVLRRLLDLLFAVCRHRYESLSDLRCSVAAVCLGALRTGELDAFTGLFAGFMKSVARELPKAACKAVATTETRLSEALRQVNLELAAEDQIVEVAYRQQARLRNVLTENPLHRQGAPWIDKDSVVLATGGGRGVTAVLAEHLLQAHGCTVIALGRTDPGLVPDELRHLDEAAFAANASQFYREQLAKDSSQKIPALKKLYESYQASHELASVIRRTEALPGKYEYIPCDINDPASLDRVVDGVLSRYGRLDAIMHGAGVQVSKMLPRKQLADFQRVVRTKVGSLSYLYKACQRHGIHDKLRVHILTSAFSYLGNDGQPDYGAANEAMNRLAGQMSRGPSGPYWSSLAWLGWAGIGMTRGTEYAALAASRGLRGVTREEGQQIFADAIAGPPASPVNILLADGEVAFYRPEIRKGVAPVAAPANDMDGLVEWTISPETMPFLSDHMVRGVPTLPGSFIIAMAGDAAQKLRPNLKVVQFERTRFLRLVRAHGGRPGKVKAISKVVEQTADETIVQVQIVMDIVHKSGYPLANDLLHTEIFVRMAPTVRNGNGDGGSAVVGGSKLPDPYVMEGSPVHLDGAFKAMQHVVVGTDTRRAEYKLNGGSRYGSDFDYLIPNIILVDAFWRFGTVREDDGGRLPVYVPERCDRMKVFFDYADVGAEILRSSITFHGANPRPEGDVLHVGPIDAVDASGRTLLRVEGGLCRKFGEIERNWMPQDHSVAIVNRRELALHNWSSVLSSREQFESSTYSNPGRRERSVTSRIVGKYLIATGTIAGFQRLVFPQIFSASNPEWRHVELLSGTASKRSAPRIFHHGNAYTDVSASSSHCGQYTASLVARTRAGLDLERIEVRRPDFYANMFSAAEKNWVSERFGAVQSHEIFTFLWTVKEAFLKASERNDLSIWNFSQWTVEATAVLEESLAQRKTYSAGRGIIRRGGVSQDVEIGVRRVDDMILTSVCYSAATVGTAFDGGGAL